MLKMMSWKDQENQQNKLIFFSLDITQVAELTLTLVAMFKTNKCINYVRLTAEEKLRFLL